MATAKQVSRPSTTHLVCARKNCVPTFAKLALNTITNPTRSRVATTAISW